jgi:hypothetical protein
MLLTHRKLLQSKAIAIENDLRGTLRNFGLKAGMVGTMRFEARILELVETIPELAVLVEPLLVVRRALREQIVILHRRLLAIVRDDEVCRRLMTTPGVGPVVALTYRATSCHQGVQTAMQALQGTRLLSGRRTALKLDSILSRQFDQERHIWLAFLEFFSASRKKTIKTASWHHAHHERHALVVSNHP